MKKNIFFVVSITITPVCGMETDTSNVWTITFGGTEINVHKGCIFDMYAQRHNIDLIVWGHYQQYYLHGLLDQREKIVGECDIITTPVVRAKKGSSLLTEFRQREKNPVFLRVIEPYFEYPSYSALRVVNSCLEDFQCGRDEAIEEASQDLALCYKNALWHGFWNLSKKITKSIALPTLATQYENSKFAFPRKEAACVAVKTIVEFIKNSVHAYDRMELFVEKQFEFILYKLLLLRYCGATDKICLLYCANKDSGSCFSLLPSEIIPCFGAYWFKII